MTPTDFIKKGTFRMRITPIQNYGYNNIKFTGSAPVNMNWRENYEPSSEKDNKSNENKKGMPEWFRKGALFGLITLAVVNDPVTKEYFKPENVKQQERVLNEYFEDVSKLGYSVPAYHLNRLADVDKPVIKSRGRGDYNIELSLDKGKKIEFDIHTSEKNDDLLYGYFKSNDGTSLKYRAVFNPKNPDEFEIFIRSKDNQKYIFGRKPNGELYKLEKGKKVILNKENTKRYQDELKAQEELDGIEFFTTKNDMWRKLNIILLVLLTLNELGHDMQRRDEAKEREKRDKK